MEFNNIVLRDNSRLNDRSMKKWVERFVMVSGGEKIVRGDTTFTTSGFSDSLDCATYRIEIKTEKPELPATTNFIIDYKHVKSCPIIDITYTGELLLPLARIYGVKLSCADGLPYDLKLGGVLPNGFRKEPYNYSEFTILDAVLTKLEHVLINTGLKTQEIIPQSKPKEERSMAALFGLMPNFESNPV